MSSESLAGSRILVLIVARIGDTLLVTPALRALKQAGANVHLTCMAHPQRREVLVASPWIDVLDCITPQAARWRGWLPGRERWDYAVVYGKDAALIRYALRVAARVVAFAPSDPSLHRRLWRAVAVPSEPMHAVHERLLLAKALEVSTQTWTLSYTVTCAESAAAQQWLQQRGLNGKFGIGLQLSSFATKSYRDWPLAHFHALLDRVLGEFAVKHDVFVVVLGDAASASAARELQERFPGRVYSTCGEFRLRESAALMSRLNLYIGVDTGPTHLAGALGLPMVALYHCYHRGRFLAPLQHPKLRVVEHPLADDACTRASSMADIAVEHVWAQVRSLLPLDRNAMSDRPAKDVECGEDQNR